MFEQHPYVVRVLVADRQAAVRRQFRDARDVKAARRARRAR